MLRPELFIQIVQRNDFNESSFNPMFPLTLHKYRTVIFKYEWTPVDISMDY